MKNFEMLMPTTLKDAVDSLPTSRTGPANEQSVRILAGGQDLLPEMKAHLAEPDVVVNLKGVTELHRNIGTATGDRAVFGSNTTEIGALVSLAHLGSSDRIQAQYGLLSEAAMSIATPQIRTQATIGGNLCQRPRCWYYRNEDTVCLKKGGDECFSYAGLNKYNAILGGGPSYIVHPSDLATALLCLNATAITTSRQLPLSQFFTLPTDSDPTRENVLEPNEVIESFALDSGMSTASGWKSAYVKFKERESFDFAISAVALMLKTDGKRITEARLCLGGVAPTPWRCESTEKLLVGREIDDKLCTEAGEEALKGAEPLEFNEYKIPLTKALIAKALRKLA
ncbi:MAG: xanthine dehydrogenase YagS FAD-binding subunit [Planctomycetota bacterium]|jgi:xanthine dehydrogenase YagS FAD-binding subunit